MKAKLALPTFEFAPQIGGVQTYLSEISQRLAANYDIYIVGPDCGPLPANSPLRRHLLPAPSFKAYWRALAQLQPDLILVGHAHPVLLLAAALVKPKAYAAIAYGNDFLAAQQRWHRPLFNRLLRQANPLITASQGIADRLNELGLAPNVVYPGTDPAHFTPASRAKTGPPTLLTISRLVARKGIDSTLHALPHVLARFPELRYQIGGDGPDRARLERLTAVLGIGHAVTFLGRIPERSLVEAYRQADIFVMPSREIKAERSIEGFGITYLEASACGLPVVAGRSGGAKEAVQEGKTGFLVTPDDPLELANCLIRLLEDAHLRQQLGQNGRDWVINQMNWDRAAAELHTILQTTYEPHFHPLR